MKNQLLSHDEILLAIDKIANLPDDATITSELASLYLNISQKQLARLRQSGDGPHYYQYPHSSSKARNQKIHYKMGDLRDWREKYKVISSMHAAIQRGLAFSKVNDLLYLQPFWVSSDTITSHALQGDVDQFSENILNEKHELRWLNWINAFDGMLFISEDVMSYKNEYIKLLNKIIAICP